MPADGRSLAGQGRRAAASSGDLARAKALRFAGEAPSVVRFVTTAHKLGPDGIRVSTLSAGTTETRARRRTYSTPGSQRHAIVIRTAPPPQAYRPGDITSGPLFLAPTEASCTTDRNLRIDGGWLASGGAGPSRPGGLRSPVGSHDMTSTISDCAQDQRRARANRYSTAVNQPDPLAGYAPIDPGQNMGALEGTISNRDNRHGLLRPRSLVPLPRRRRRERDAH